MNGIEKITARIAQDAQADVQATLSQAQAEADRILADYRAQARAAKETILAQGHQEKQARQARLDSMAQLEARKGRLAAKQGVITEAFDMALEALCALPEKEMVSLLARLAAEHAQTGKEAILLAPAQREAIGQEVVRQANAKLGQGELTLGPAAPEIQGGLILRQGAVDVNCTFAMLVRRQRSVLSGQVAKILFPQEGKA